MCYQVCLETFILFLFITSFATGVDETIKTNSKSDETAAILDKAVSFTDETSTDIYEATTIDLNDTNVTENSSIIEITMTSDTIRTTPIKITSTTTTSGTTTQTNSAIKHSVLHVFVFMIIVQIIK
ncbi:unnamed protein product [Rotaria sp. Silwood1]|nr:unnamed protein product [Rotaria sp. Silwood1]CAF4929659.1 unnamed protein product [Rotaria sp. Silwood1]